MSFYQHYDRVVRETEMAGLERRSGHARALDEARRTDGAGRSWRATMSRAIAGLLPRRGERSTSIQAAVMADKATMVSRGT